MPRHAPFFVLPQQQQQTVASVSEATTTVSSAGSVKVLCTGYLCSSFHLALVSIGELRCANRSIPPTTDTAAMRVSRGIGPKRLSLRPGWV